LESAKVIILLVSEAALENVKNADKWQDNMLLEYERAMEKADHHEVKLYPLLVGKLHGNSLEKFSGFNVDAYPNAKHASPKSKNNVRETMRKLFKQQGQHNDPSSYEEKVPALLAMLE